LKTTVDVQQVMLDVLDEGVRHRIFDVSLERLGIEFPIARLVEVYRSHQPDIHLSATAHEALTKARSLGEVGVITDGPSKLQWAKIRALQLESYVNHVVVNDDYGAETWKPSEAGFLRVMAAMDAQKFCYIGDNPEKDFEAPTRLGWTTIRTTVDNPMYQRKVVVDAQFVVSDLSGIWEVWP